jgi:hypothetical protein
MIFNIKMDGSFTRNKARLGCMLLAAVTATTDSYMLALANDVSIHQLCHHHHGLCHVKVCD